MRSHLSLRLTIPFFDGRGLSPNPPAGPGRLFSAAGLDNHLAYVAPPGVLALRTLHRRDQVIGVTAATRQLPPFGPARPVLSSATDLHGHVKDLAPKANHRTPHSRAAPPVSPAPADRARGAARPPTTNARRAFR